MKDINITWQQKRYLCFFTSLFIAVIGFFLYFNVQNSDSNINPSDLTTIDSLVISEKPIYQEIKGKTPSKWIQFKCKGYSKRFDIESFDYKCVNDNEILNELNVGDTVKIKILTKDLADINQETFLQKSNPVHELVCKDKIYLDLSCRNKSAKDNNKLVYLVCFIIAPIILTFALFKRQPKIFGKTLNIEIFISVIILLLIYIISKTIK